MDAQTGVAIGITVASAVYLVRRWIRVYKGKASACHCASCPRVSDTCAQTNACASARDGSTRPAPKGL